MGKVRLERVKQIHLILLYTHKSTYKKGAFCLESSFMVNILDDVGRGN
jgi:hypothetical protein